MIISDPQTKKMREMLNHFASLIKEQNEKEQITTINSVDVKIMSTDDLDLELKDDEKNQITQLIDQFHQEVSNIVEFDSLLIYENSTKLSGVIPQLNIKFVFSSGDDEGLFLTNISTLKINQEISEMINKLMDFQEKYVEITENLIRNRKEN